jgi:hypothetical protein
MASPDRAERGTGRASGAVWITTVCPEACRLGCQWLRVVRSAITVAAVFLNGSCRCAQAALHVLHGGAHRGKQWERRISNRLAPWTGCEDPPGLTNALHISLLSKASTLRMMGCHAGYTLAVSGCRMMMVLAWPADTPSRSRRKCGAPCRVSTFRCRCRARAPAHAHRAPRAHPHNTC